eukprot:CAMPEP_0201536552 /NCGR_PEP_ID=MMETSP0161_2-20130828/62130_1 /ASSEMBLY_ACC=CAM_ASM_000251 /TAXON_ID=180227 /ORGANISM="Neoparamoeba aestuarina, Strain SoJaBio B1-5/56/2" /LENGTH=103 /DNA_ID=CAMNT_0047942313 /DNA_START=622 /DNA_END=929 /DNA_ORIENTATION=+
MPLGEALVKADEEDLHRPVDEKEKKKLDLLAMMDEIDDEDASRGKPKNSSFAKLTSKKKETYPTGALVSSPQNFKKQEIPAEFLAVMEDMKANPDAYAGTDNP